jgi:hypothetical protein
VRPPAVENIRVFGLAQIKQVGGLEHDGKLGETGPAANSFSRNPARHSALSPMVHCQMGDYQFHFRWGERPREPARQQPRPTEMDMPPDVLRLPFAAAGVFSP